MLLVFFITLLDGLDLSVVNLTLPSISDDLGITASNSSWVLNAYSLGIAAPLLAFVKIADSGKVRFLFIAGIVTFTVSSLFCGLSDSYVMLIFSRLAKGVGASMMGATAPIIVVRMLPEDMKGRGMAMLSMSMGVSLVLGPIMGGIILSITTWHWVFLSVVPMGAALAILGFIYIPKSTGSNNFQFPDIPSVIYTGLTVSLVLVVLENIVYSTMATYSMIICIVGAALFFILLVRRMRIPDLNHLIHINMLMNREFLFVAGAFLLTTMVAAGFLYMLPFFLQDTWAMSEGTSAIFLTLLSALAIVSSMYTGKWCDTKGCKTPATLSIILRIGFCIPFTFMVPEWGIIPLILVLLIVGFSFGLSTVSQNTRIVQHTKVRYQAEASAVMLQIHYIACSLGVVVYAIILNAIAKGSVIVTPEMICEGMHLTSLLGALLCVIALIFTVLVRNIVPEPKMGE